MPGTVVYVCDPEPAAAHVLAARHPDAPNLHDLKALAWADIPVGVLTAGYPCQPFSGAGKRAGTEDPRHLWPWIAQGIARSRPPTVFLENVRGHLSLGWDTVLCDLHRLGYDVRWTLLRAADVGAAHNRARLFAVAVDRDAHRWDAPAGWPVARIADGALNAPHDGLFGANPLPVAENGHVPMWPAGLMIGGVVWEHDAGGFDLRTAVEMLPTPTARDWKGAGPADSDRHDPNLSAIGYLLPTPTARDWKDGAYCANVEENALLGRVVWSFAGEKPTRWGRYAAAVARCEALTRPAPSPTLPSGKGGAHRLSPLFVEFLMMLPAGWVTDPDLWTHMSLGAARNAQLKLLGNGCVTPQATAAWEHLTSGLQTTTTRLRDVGHAQGYGSVLAGSSPPRPGPSGTNSIQSDHSEQDKLMAPIADDNRKPPRLPEAPLLGLADLTDIHERHLLAVSLLGHRIQDDGTLIAADVADLVTLLHGTKS